MSEMKMVDIPPLIDPMVWAASPIVGKPYFPTARDYGWIEWSGGPCPVKPETRVEVRFRNGERSDGRYADDLSWYHDGEHDDIITYRVVRDGEENITDGMLFLPGYAGVIDVARKVAADPEERLPDGAPSAQAVDRYRYSCDVAIGGGDKTVVRRMLWSTDRCAPPGPAERKHVSDAAREIYERTWGLSKASKASLEGDMQRAGLVLLTVTEHEALTRSKETYDFLSKEDQAFSDKAQQVLCGRGYAGWNRLDAAVTEVQRLDAENAELRAEIVRLRREVGAAHELLGLGELDSMEERLRERGNDHHHGLASSAAVERVPTGPVARIALLVADTLDHRLGLPQPDGAPVEPMSARSWRRVMR